MMFLFVFGAVMGGIATAVAFLSYSIVKDYFDRQFQRRSNQK